MKLLLLGACCVAAWAHDLQITVQLAQPAVIARCSYAGQEPAPFIQVRVFSLQNGKKEHQNGRTDRRGVFSFVPDEPGDWLLSADDEMGHVQQQTIHVTPAGLATGATATFSGLNTAQKLLTGVGIILGMTGFLYGFQARRVRRM